MRRLAFTLAVVLAATAASADDIEFCEIVMISEQSFTSDGMSITETELPHWTKRVLFVRGTDPLLIEWVMEIPLFRKLEPEDGDVLTWRKNDDVITIEGETIVRRDLIELAGNHFLITIQTGTLVCPEAAR